MKNVFVEFFSELLGKMKYYVSFIRVYNTRSMILFYLLGRKLGGNLRMDIDILIIPIIFILVYAYASILNFIYDQKIDQLNKRANPFLNNHHNLKKLEILNIVFIISSFLLSFLSIRPFISVLMTSVLLLLSYIYSAPPLKFSHHPFGKIVIMATVYLAIPAILGLDRSLSVQTLMIIFPIIIYYGSFFMYSDIKDMKGDKKYGKRTVAVVLGLQKTLWVSALLGVASSIYLLLISRQSVFYPNAFAFLIIVPSMLQVIAAVKPQVVQVKKYGMLVGYILMSLLVFLIIFYRQW